MCGIAGIVDARREPIEPARLAAMVATLEHRGPDDSGVEWPVPWVGLGHRRLSIIDVEGGHQPLSNETGEVWVTYNGEIFNHLELRRELEGKGHVFRTRSDTEVIVHLYEEEGPDCVRRLEGQFAFALWDGARLLCARDPVGIKPLHYAWDGRRFAFASEPRALLALEAAGPEPDLDGLRLFLRYRFVPPPRAALRGMGKLRPGELLVLEPGGELRRTLYWGLEAERLETLHDVERANDLLCETLERCVRSQLMSDVPVGAFLSGGLDSSAVVAMMVRSGALPSTFSIGFEDPRYDEREYARLVADRFGTRHRLAEACPERARQLIEDFLDQVDEPFGDPAVVPSLMVARLAREEVKVTLAGDGGDELFAGYGRYYRALSALALPPWLRPLQRWWGSGRDLRDPSAWRYADRGSVRHRYHRALMRTTADERRALYGPALRERARHPLEDPVEDVFDRIDGFPPLSRVLAADLLTVLPEYYLTKVDRTSMMTSLEVRVPLLDVRMIDLAFSMAPAVRLHGGMSKGLLRRVLRGVLPERVVERRTKRGLGPPLKYWFGGQLAQLARERLSDRLCVREGLVAPGVVERLLGRTRAGRVKGGLLWQILVLEAWLHNLRRRDPAPGAAPREGET